ncbi:FBP domain-containing protein [Actinorugispora endophytica]|uniref:Treble-clef zinc-finger protein n=1 Tax=Actinorugispora endophytica TaxID=1605990 RepID=A0A4V3D8S5_9ACTN|nr:FBP domain-containing protein [Actinorugispora endophytica]TDQ52891.1 treble-clef zinc-finger protein [Actinorugispora endophytica]
MRPLTESEIRGSFVNCSKGEARRANLPKGLADLPWDDLDFLGWQDPGAPDRGYIVAERDGGLAGITLRVPPGVRRSLTKTTVCSICLTAHAGTGVSLLTARKVGAAGRQGNTVGAYMCADLACPLYVRGRKKSPLVERYEESLTMDEQVTRALVNLDMFLDKVFDVAGAPPAAR